MGEKQIENRDRRENQTSSFGPNSYKSQQTVTSIAIQIIGFGCNKYLLINPAHLIDCLSCKRHFVSIVI